MERTETYKPASRSRMARLARVIPWETLILVLIWLNVLAMVLETVASVQSRYAAAFAAFERISVYAFTAEFLVRLWKGRLKFATSPWALLDFLAIAPFYLSALAVDLRVLRIARTFRVARLARIAKLGRYFAGLQTLGRVIATRRGELIAVGGVMLMLLLIGASIMYYAESAAQPNAFSSIPAALWWAVTTLTSVGYGDIYPVTPVGRLFGSLVAFLGVATFAIPAGIIGAGFVDEFQRRRTETDGRCPHCGR